MLSRVALTGVFVLSFWTYLAPETTMWRRFAPFILFAALVFLRVVWSNSILKAVGSLFDPEGLLFILGLSVLMLGPSLASDFQESIQYWFLTAACLVLARIYMSIVPVKDIMESFFWAGVVSLAVLLCAAIGDIRQAMMSLTRFSAFSFQPNDLAFILAGYCCTFFWKMRIGRWPMKALACLSGLASVAIIFLASSRGSLVALVIGFLFIAGMAVFKAEGRDRQRLLKLGLAAILLAGTIATAGQRFSSIRDTFSFTDQVLALSTPDRGIDSGFTGRIDVWRRTLHQLSDGTWLTGRGLRSSDSLYPSIDNSYIVILYELGLLPFVLIVWRFFAVGGGFVRNYFSSHSGAELHFFLACSLLMVVFITNDIVGRFMFALANPYSFLSFLLFATPAARLRVYGLQTATDRHAPVHGRRMRTHSPAW